MESKILQACSLEKDKKKKDRKRGATETEPLVRCSSSAGEEEKKEEEETTEPEPEPGQLRDGLVRCSSPAYEEKKTRKKKKKKMEETAEAPEPEREPPVSRGLVGCSFSSEKEKEVSKYDDSPVLEPLVTTVTKTTTTTTSITLITPPEDPNNHIDIYLCIQTDIHELNWFKIDPTDTTVESSNTTINNYTTSEGNIEKKKKKKQRMLLTPFSHMPPNTPYGFCAIPHSSGNGKQRKKLVYAVGGSSDYRGRSPKAFVCDFATSTTANPNPNPPVWDELPPLPSPLYIQMGVASPLNGHIYAFGPLIPEGPGVRAKYVGHVFNPFSTSWNPCPPPFTEANRRLCYPVDDYALIHTQNRTEFRVFTASTQAHSFNLTTAQWEGSLHVPLPTPTYLYTNEDVLSSSSVGVGHLIFKFHKRKLYALDSSSPKPSFKPVPGLDNKLPKYWEARGSGDIVYLGKGKLCIVWGCCLNPFAKAPESTLSITCLMFWVGMCNRRNRLRAVVDRCERFVTRGTWLYNVIAL